MNPRYITIAFLICAAVLLPSRGLSLDILPQEPVDTIYNPNVIYSPMPKTYEIAGIKVSGVNTADDYLIIGFSGLSIGDKVEIPGEAITNAV